jgi:hypothetical protein
MQQDLVEFRGNYRYASHAALERALEAVRAHLDDDELDVDWSRLFVRHGMTLRVNAALPLAADRFLAATVVDALACNAIEGVVEARRGGVVVDWFPPGEDP